MMRLETDTINIFSRSLCPGQQFADSSVWIAAANIIATLDISAACDGAGKRITQSAAFRPGFVR